MPYRKVLYRGKFAEKQIHNVISAENRKKLFADDWVTGFYIPESAMTPFGDTHPIPHIVKTGDPKEIFTGMWFTVIDDTVGEYVGLNDINKKPIFEGDVVKGQFGGKQFIGVIQWQPLEARFLVYIPACGGEWLPLDGLQLTIVGNIHDNPELLEA